MAVFMVFWGMCFNYPPMAGDMTAAEVARHFRRRVPHAVLQERRVRAAGHAELLDRVLDLVRLVSGRVLLPHQGRSAPRGRGTNGFGRRPARATDGLGSKVGATATMGGRSARAEPE